MKAVIHSAFGPATDVLSVADVARPSVEPREVLVRVRAAGIGKGTWLITHGLPYIARPMYGFRSPRERIAGLEFAGEVEATGAEVSDFQRGDAIFGFHAGAMAEFVAVPEDSLALKPDNISFDMAAATPVSGIAALQAVRDAGKVRQGCRVLLLGASGNVGRIALQVAKHYGARVTAVGSTANLELMRRLGADEVLDYTRAEIPDAVSRYDVIIDIAGNRAVSTLRSALVDGGRLVIVGGTGSRLTMGFERTVAGMLLSPFVGHEIVGFISSPNRDDLRLLAALMESGSVTPEVDRTFPLERAAEAIELVGSGRGGGAHVLTP
jgi:NADPH:quinone reductase-like Zn-dependent oxidoreductase